MSSVWQTLAARACDERPTSRPPRGSCHWYGGGRRVCCDWIRVDIAPVAGSLEGLGRVCCAGGRGVEFLGNLQGQLSVPCLIQRTCHWQHADGGLSAAVDWHGGALPASVNRACACCHRSLKPSQLWSNQNRPVWVTRLYLMHLVVARLSFPSLRPAVGSPPAWHRWLPPGRHLCSVIDSSCR